MATTPRKGKNFCARHDTSYGALEQCSACETDPGPAPDDAIAEEPVVFPDGIPDPDDEIREWIDDARELVAMRRALWSKNDDGVLDPHIANAYIKAQGELSKIRRSIIDYGKAFRDQVLFDRREKRLAKGAKGASGAGH